MLCWSARRGALLSCLLLSLTATSLMARASKAMMGLGTFTAQHVPSLFLPSNTAEFVAAAGSISSIPSSMRLPEVAETARHHSLTRCTSFEKRLL
jgi:hypothetical protein